MTYRKEKPEIGEFYYYISRNHVSEERFFDEEIDNERFAIGNFFLNEDQAYFELERRKVIAELEQYAIPYENLHEYRTFLQIKYLPKSDTIFYSRVDTVYSSLLFATKNDCIRAIKKVGKDRLKAYYFGMG